jgi:uncharacterized protein YcgI (DUF1989 family)
VCGNSHASHVEARWGKRDYQQARNDWHQNGYDSFLVELAKYNMTRGAMAANVNWFSAVGSDAEGNLSLKQQAKAGDSVTLRFDMDALVLMHTCPHPLNTSASYPDKPVQLRLSAGVPMKEDDLCLNHCEENRRGFANNALYLMGHKS